MKMKKMGKVMVLLPFSASQGKVSLMPKISVLQSYMIIILSVGLLNHVIIIPLLLGSSGRDAWLVVLLVLIASPIWIGILSHILKNMNGMHVRDWLKQQFGMVLSVTLIVLYSVLVWLMGVISLKDTITWTIATYMPQSPMLVLAGTTLFGCFFAAFKGLRTIAILSGILLPFVVILGDLVMVANFQFKDYTMLFPLLENGLSPLWKGIPYAAGGLLELSLLILFQHKLTKKPGFKSLMLICIILSGLTLGPLMGSIAMYGPDEAAHQRYPPFEQWRMVRLGEYVEHIDFFSIYQWLSGMYIRVSLSLLLLSELWELQKYKWLPMFLGALFMLVVTLLPISDMIFQDLLSRYYFPLFCVFTIVVMFVYFVRILISTRSKRSN
ncbi:MULTISPECIES: endospore germination permease [Paenibacillus]|uniref:Spore germination protein n=3 Tax=Paenibacillus TaxID=44249 RepID=G4HIQ0_9BACL|nr:MULTISPECIES: endospore germination permease [Paenibacillus]EHB62618.1 spore germination protein [Paenibacillus lactis 154]PAD76382.1 spore gernimation protein [Paenibacillus campinasensis]